MNDKPKAYIDKLQAEKFWGQVTYKLEAGRVVFIRTEQGMKVDELNLSGTPKKGGHEQCS